MKIVSEEEFLSFLGTFPYRSLTSHRVRMCEPEFTNLTDPDGKVVARIVHEWMKDGVIDNGSKFWEYKIQG